MSEQAKPVILVTNDDGIEAPGIEALVAAMSRIGRVIVVAPLGEQSAVGHALTVSLPLRVTHHNKNGKFFGYAVSGTPADCVKLALRTLLAAEGLPIPDIVVSGINHGRNTAVNIIYSGTISAATEATVLDVPGVAFSLTSYNPEADFSAAATFAREFVPLVIKHGLPRGTLLNINVPDVPFEEIKGFRYTRQGQSYWEDTFEQREDPMHRPYYWLKGKYVRVDSESDSDDLAIDEGIVSITPLQYDLTDHSFLEHLRSNWPDAL